MQTPFYRNVLSSTLTSRRKRNARYSLRAFARALGVDAGLLSKIMNARMVPSDNVARQIAVGLELSAEEQRLFLKSVTEHRLETAKAANDGDETETKARTEAEIEAEAFQTISRMYHYAILELTNVKGFRPEPRWIAERTGITTIEAEQAVARLLRLGLLAHDKDTLRKTSTRLEIKNRDLSTPALRQHQREVLRRGVVALEKVPIERRSNSSLTMAIDPAKLNLARDLIRDFSDRLCTLLSTEESTEVYQLGVALFPVRETADFEG